MALAHTTEWDDKKPATPADIVDADGHFTDEFIAALFLDEAGAMAEEAGLNSKELLINHRCGACRLRIDLAMDTQAELTQIKDQKGTLDLEPGKHIAIKLKLHNLQQTSGLTAPYLAMRRTVPEPEPKR